MVPEQHPLGQEVPLQTHAPLTHACPEPHGALLPHLHEPDVHRSLVADEHVEHDPPPVPQALVDCGSQTPPLQHPPGHDVALQTHDPLTQAWPIAHACPDPHAHAPPAHESARVELHAAQVAPRVPHSEAEGVTHVEPMQQPVGQEPVAPDVQVHVPLTQACPAPQGGPLPQEQSPIAEHRSAVITSHAAHASPPKPQAVSERELQLGPEQQPVAQVAAQPEQAPALQVSPPGQLAHALPPLPQAPAVLPARHMLPLQQPVPQETPSHTQDPLRQRWPELHAPPVPQTHAPAAEQLSAAPAGQAAQAAPAAPQEVSERGVHTLPAQQPFGQDVASHTHVPCEQ